MRIKLVVQYDGTDFCGWAEQPDQRTVQSTLKECIHRATGQEVELRGASRTDSGAHALGQVADFRTNLPIEPRKWSEIVNRWLPGDIRIADSSEVPDEFHSRFFARSRTYLYRISLEQKADPLKSRYVFEGGYRLDVASMRKAARLLEGEHDFRAFGEELEAVQNTRRCIYRTEVTAMDDEVRIELEANAFLRGMVRRISGGLFEVGRGRRSLESLATLLDPQKRKLEQWPVVLPAKGLTLLRVEYGSSMRDLRSEQPGDN